MNKKGIFATILVVQLIFLVILAIFVVQNERTNFEYEKEYRKIATYRINAVYEDIEEGMLELISENANQNAKDSYVSFINNEFSKYNNILINFTEISLDYYYLELQDSELEIIMRGHVQ